MDARNRRGYGSAQFCQAAISPGELQPSRGSGETRRRKELSTCLAGFYAPPRNLSLGFRTRWPAIQLLAGLVPYSTSGTELSKSIVRSRNYTSFVAVFLRAHAVVFKGQSVGKLKILISSLCSGDLLETYIQSTGPAFQIDGIYIATINIAALLEHGEIQSSTGCSIDSVANHTRWLFTQVMAIILRTRGPYVFSLSFM